MKSTNVEAGALIYGICSVACLWYKFLPVAVRFRTPVWI